jgi:hypothetical protein
VAAAPAVGQAEVLELVGVDDDLLQAAAVDVAELAGTVGRRGRQPRSAVRTGITSVRRVGRQVVVGGRLTPATPAGVAALQRQGADGRWLPLRRARTDATGRYSINVRSRRQPMIVRPIGLPHDGGGHVRGVSRTVTIAGLR